MRVFTLTIMRSVTQCILSSHTLQSGVFYLSTTRAVTVVLFSVVSVCVYVCLFLCQHDELLNR